ncbi:ribokinase [Leifsonia poae]|uniref:ribokinase n=1 Tax=Leifsonia poae TaxID=110933 RepID=UPI001CC0326B|nr:ribokinase [Leifsonia poae]
MTAVVAVVGSANLDVVVSTPRRPAGGETLTGTALLETPGGKGANQAIASAAVGATALIGEVGADSAGRRIREALTAADVDISRMRMGPLPTGRAYITLTPDGENSIVVLPLANGALDSEHVSSALGALNPAVVLTQLEVPMEVVEAVAAWCATVGARFVLNPSPIGPLPDAVLRAADPVIVNQGEAQALLGTDSTDWHDLARRLGGLARSAVVTAGSQGAVVAEADGEATVPGHAVEVVDTTGAGDAFAGTLAAHLAAGASLADAARAANATAAQTVQRARSER